MTYTSYLSWIFLLLDIYLLLSAFYRLHDNFSPIDHILLPGQTIAEVKAQVELETKTVAELLSMNPYDHQVNICLACAAYVVVLASGSICLLWTIILG